MTLVLADLHGRADLLEKLLGKISPETKLVFIGDAFDRGPRNRDTMKLLAQLADEGRMTILKGNHEDMVDNVDASYDRFRNEAKDSKQFDVRRADARLSLENWIRNGGDSVILEYGGLDNDGLNSVGPDGQPDGFGEWGLPPELIAYTKRCQIDYRFIKEGGDILCIHAAPPDPSKMVARTEDWVLWARPEDGPFVLPAGVKLSIHGHTPIRAPMRIKDSVFIDLGAFWTGHLCAFELETETIKVFKGEGANPLENLPTLEAVGGVEPIVLPYEVIELD